MEYRVSKLGKAIFDCFQRFATVVRLKILHVFEEHCGRTFCFDYFREIEEGDSLDSILEPVLRSGYREWLAWKPGGKDVMVWYVSRLYISDIACRRLAEPCFVGLLRERIPFG